MCLLMLPPQLQLLFPPACFIAKSKSFGKKIHSGKYDVATYFDKESNLSDKDLLDFMKNV